VYEASAERYVRFVGTEIGAATEGPIDRSLQWLSSSWLQRAAMPRLQTSGVDPGGWPHLAAHGLSAVRIDVSPAMFVEAGRAYPDIAFKVGRLDDLPFSAGTLAGAVCSYSNICTPPECLDESFAELRRVLNPADSGCSRSKSAMVRRLSAWTRTNPGFRLPFTGTDSSSRDGDDVLAG
jgi:Methyltransferase domain